MRRRRFLSLRNVLVSLVALTGLLPLADAGEKKATRKPNILVIVADDLGYADLGCQGCRDIATPHIDSLAKNGVRFTSGYVSGTYCSPTRAGLLTGRYQTRFGHEFNPGPAQKADKGTGLPLSETTLADLLKALGYTTGLVGKWHLGYEAAFHPQKRGFDEYFGFLGGAHSYVNATKDKANPILRGFKAVDEKDYLTDAFTREALAFLDRHKKEPFFLMLTYNATHGPMEVSPRHQGKFADIKDSKRRTFATMLTALDEGIGRVLTKLRELGLEEDTLIIFVSDNGGPTAVNSSRNDPLRGFKAQVWEGGVRVPFLMQWKGRLPAGKVYDHPIIALDILPTAVAAAEGKVPDKLKIDGVNLLPYLTGKNDKAPHELLFWRFGAQWAVRKGDWKLTHIAGKELHLADLAADIGQTKDLAAQKPEVLKELETAYRKWNAEMVEPLVPKKAKMKEETGREAADQRTSVGTVPVNKVRPALVTVRYALPAGLPKDKIARPLAAIGVIVDPKGIVIAPYAGLPQGAPMQVVLGDGSKLPARTILTDPTLGLAVFKVEADKPLPFAAFSDSAQLEVGGTVLALAWTSGSPSYEISAATISANDRRLATGEKVLQIDSAIGPGLGVGVVIDLKGNVAGLLPKAGGIGLAVPSSRLKEIVTKLPASK